MRKGRGNLMNQTLTAKMVYDNWIDNCRSGHTKESYSRIVPMFFNMTLGIEIEEITSEILKEIKPALVDVYYKRPLIAKGLKQSTVINYLKVVGAFFYELEVNDLFPNVNYLKIKERALSYDRLKDDTQARSRMSVTDYDVCYDWLMNKEFSKRYHDKGIKYAAALKFMYTTAIRIESTFANIKWKNIVRTEDFIGQEGWTIYAKDKGDKVNEKPISDEYYEELHSLLYEGSDDDLVFQGLSKQGFTRLLKEFSDETGRKVTPHSIKVGAGTKLYSMTKDLVLTQRFLDHEDPKTTVRYIRNDDRSQTGSHMLSKNIDIDMLDNISYEDLLSIVKDRKDLAYSTVLEAERRGVILSGEK